MNKLLEALKNENNFAYTENGARTHTSTLNKVLDMFAMGGAYRNRSDEDIILLFKEAYEENPELALKCLFYIRDIMQGQGERRFFRVAYNWLAKNYPNVARLNIANVHEFGRWDDLYCLVSTPVEESMFEHMYNQIVLDISCKNSVSLCAKWLKSINASSTVTRELGEKTRQAFGLTCAQYRHMLSRLRGKINIVETLMSQGRWDEIEFDKIPSGAGLKYKNAFARNDIIKEKYNKFAFSKETTVNAKTLYPYQVVEKAIKVYSDTDRAMVNKYWDNLTDYFNEAKLDALCIIDTSGSMWGQPINVAISLGLYCAERNHGPWHNHYISFSSRPQLIETKGVDFCDKVERIYRTNLCENTNIEAAFDMVLRTAIKYKTDIPKNIIVISDMEFDEGTSYYSYGNHNTDTLMEEIARKFKNAGYECPHLIYWNVDARQNNIPMIGHGRISYVSGFSPVIFQTIMSGKSGEELMLEKLNSERYASVKVKG